MKKNENDMKYYEYEFEQIVRINRDDLFLEETNKDDKTAKQTDILNIVSDINEIMSKKGSDEFDQLKFDLCKKVLTFHNSYLEKKKEIIFEKIELTSNNISDIAKDLQSTISEMDSGDKVLNMIKDIVEDVQKNNKNPIRDLFTNIISNYDKEFFDFYGIFCNKMELVNNDTDVIELVEIYYEFIRNHFLINNFKIKSIFLNDNFMANFNTRDYDFFNYLNSTIETSMEKLFNSKEVDKNSKEFEEHEKNLISYFEKLKDSYLYSFFLVKNFFNYRNSFFINRDLSTVKKLAKSYLKNAKIDFIELLNSGKKQYVEKSKIIWTIINKNLDGLQENFSELHTGEEMVTDRQIDKKSISKVSDNVFVLESDVKVNDMEEYKMIEKFKRKSGEYREYIEKYNDFFKKLKNGCESREKEINSLFAEYKKKVNKININLTKELESVNTDLTDGSIKEFYELRDKIYDIVIEKCDNLQFLMKKKIEILVEKIEDFIVFSENEMANIIKEYDKDTKKLFGETKK